MPTPSPTQLDIAFILSIEMMRKSGVQEWADPAKRQEIAQAAAEMAALLVSAEATTMALPDIQRVQTGTTKTFKSSGGDAAITTASLANNAARQSAKLDLGSTRAELYQVKANVEMAATPTAGNVIDIYWAPSTSATAATDNPGNVSGSDAAYSGYSSNLDASVKQLLFIGSFILTAQATSTVQKAHVGFLAPPARYGSLVVYNKGGSAFHSSDTNIEFVLVPIEGVIEDT